MIDPIILHIIHSWRNLEVGKWVIQQILWDTHCILIAYRQSSPRTEYFYNLWEATSRIARFTKRRPHHGWVFRCWNDNRDTRNGTNHHQDILKDTKPKIAGTVPGQSGATPSTTKVGCFYDALGVEAQSFLFRSSNRHYPCLSSPRKMLMGTIPVTRV